MNSLISKPVDTLSGISIMPGDKSISHRAVLFSALAAGKSEIYSLLEGDDVKRTACAIADLGCHVEPQSGGQWMVSGCGIGGLSPSNKVLNMGNSGTAARLLLGILAGYDFTTFLTGDKSLCKRPMDRITVPLSKMGATFRTSEGRLPIAITGAERLLPLEYHLPMASAQVKSAILLAGLHAPGETTVIEPEPTRDHTERMLCHFGGTVSVNPHKNGGNSITIKGQPELVPAKISIPGDFSSAAFPIVGALILPGSKVKLPRIGVNQGRIGLLTTLNEMGAKIDSSNNHENGTEPIADLTIRHSELHGVDVPAERAPSMIDEFPILAIAAACAEGPTTMHGLKELRVKESDRLTAIIDGLVASGIQATTTKDTLTIQGVNGRPQGGNRNAIKTHFDHRIAMSFLILGMCSQKPIMIDDGRSINTSFPNFVELINQIGGNISDLENQ